MSFKNKLSRLSMPPPEAPAPVPQNVSLEALPGTVTQTDAGEVRIISQRVPLTTSYGAQPLAHVHDVEGDYLATASRQAGVADLAPSDFLYLDTETTGLAGGTGTTAFLVGLAWVEDDALVVEQLFLDHLAHEPAQLARVAERVASASALCSFNGRTFDWPLLRNRWIMNRMAVPDCPVHVDLLHMARRQLGASVTSHRLVALEREVLDYHRVDDIPGSEIPEAYFGYLRTGEPGRMASVIEHNHQDMVAMAALLARLHRRYRGDDRVEHPAEHLALGQEAFRQKDWSGALDYAAKAVFLGEEADTITRAAHLGARACRHLKRPEKARALLEAALQTGDPPAIHLALAKLLEHHFADPAAASHHAQRATGADKPDAIAHRLARLARKAG